MISAKHLLLQLLCLISAGTVSKGDGHCIFYGYCPSRSFFDTNICPYDGAAKPLDNLGQSILEKNCPHMIDSENVSTCCDIEQINTLARQIYATRRFLGHCRSCYENLVKLFCEVTCSPRQSDFMNITGILRNHDDAYPLIRSIDLYIAEEYMSAIYDGCSTAVDADTDNLIMDLGCIHYDEDDCDVHQWFHAMHHGENNILLPFPVTYIPTTDAKVDDMTPLRPEITTCEIDRNATKSNCGCARCEEICPDPTPPTIPEEPISGEVHDLLEEQIIETSSKSASSSSVASIEFFALPVSLVFIMCTKFTAYFTDL